MSNIGYAYGHLNDNDKTATTKNDNEKVVNVKSTSTQHKKKWSDKEFEEEDHFFHSLYHNNDEDEKVVTNVSCKKIKNKEDEDDFHFIEDAFNLF